MKNFLNVQIVQFIPLLLRMVYNKHKAKKASPSPSLQFNERKTLFKKILQKKKFQIE